MHIILSFLEEEQDEIVIMLQNYPNELAEMWWLMTLLLYFQVGISGESHLLVIQPSEQKQQQQQNNPSNLNCS